MNGVANLSLAGRSQVGEIAFIDLKAQQRLIRGRIEARLGAVLDHGRYIAGPEIEELEEALSARTGAKATLACASGTAALIIPLLAWEVSEGDAVFLPAFTYNASANAVLLAGATPVFVDIDPETFNIDPRDLERRIAAVRKEGVLTPRVVMPVDLFGSPADYQAIEAIARRDGLLTLADAAQSFGGAFQGRSVGDLAEVTATSFFPGKALGAYGDAGAILTRDPSLLEAWRSLRWHGTDPARKISLRVGFNGRMDSFQAAVLLEKLAIFDEELAARRTVASRYAARLASVARLQRHLDGAASGYSYFSIRVRNRGQVAEHLKRAGVPTAVYYATPLHKMPAFAAYAPAGGLPRTDAAAEEILSLPMHAYLSPDQVEYVCDAVIDSVQRAR